TYLLVGGIIWIERIFYYVQLRESQEQPWVRLAGILFLVAVFTWPSALFWAKKKIQKSYAKKSAGRDRPYLPSYSVFLLTAILLTIIHWKVKPPILLLERFLPGSGMIEVALLAIYAGWITEKMLDPKISSKIKSHIWTLFSVVFFSQFILGLAGLEKCLMTGKLHLPIPAMIIAGPISRGRITFMLILFIVTALLVGAAWCSHLCYIGSWDNLSSRHIRRPNALPKWNQSLRIGIFTAIILAAFLFKLFGLTSTVGTAVAIAYGIAGVGVMIFISRKNGVMTHCVIYCPIGLAANLIGRLSPFRIRFKNTCDDCGACRYSCRYDALNEKQIKKRKPGLTCTLCGDCIPSCSKEDLKYGFFGLSAGTARTIFLVVIVSLHAVFLGVARI
ncbi:MAG: 4Fe-4S binding protein, partial [Candidatus Aminicenantes bacterium]